MRKILKLMESTTEHALRPFLVLTLLMIIMNIASFLWAENTVNQTYIDIHHHVGLLVVWMISIAFILHIRRFRRKVTEAGFTRIRLLPISPTTYFFSEVVFVLGTLLIILAGYYLSILLIYVFYTMLISPMENGLIYMILYNQGLSMLIPITLSGLFVLFGQVLLIALIMTILCISQYSSSMLIRNGMIFLFGVLNIFMFNGALSNMGSYIHANTVYDIVKFLPYILDAFLIWYGMQVFKKRKIGG